MNLLGRLAGTLGFLAAALALIAGVLFLALITIHRATCGPPDSARPQYILVLPGQEIPEDCRRARTGFSILVEGLGVREGERQ